jgi:hypothetical protein
MEGRMIFKIHLKQIVYGSVGWVHVIEVRVNWQAVLDRAKELRRS